MSIVCQPTTRETVASIVSSHVTARGGHAVYAFMSPYPLCWKACSVESYPGRSALGEGEGRATSIHGPVLDLPKYKGCVL